MTKQKKETLTINAKIIAITPKNGISQHSGKPYNMTICKFREKGPDKPIISTILNDDQLNAIPNLREQANITIKGHLDVVKKGSNVFHNFKTSAIELIPSEELTATVAVPIKKTSNDNYFQIALFYKREDNSNIKFSNVPVHASQKHKYASFIAGDTIKLYGESKYNEFMNEKGLKVKAHSFIPDADPILIDSKNIKVTPSKNQMSF